MRHHHFEETGKFVKNKQFSEDHSCESGCFFVQKKQFFDLKKQ